MAQSSIPGFVGMVSALLLLPRNRVYPPPFLFVNRPDRQASRSWLVEDKLPLGSELEGSGAYSPSAAATNGGVASAPRWMSAL